MSDSTAVICEFNPIHPGHRHLLSLARTGGGPVICVMSGHFSERGTPALFDKYARAEAAVRCGADLVLELPYPWSASGAEDFARGGCAVAAGIGAGSLTFGSESGDLSLLREAADYRGSEEFRSRMVRAEAERRGAGSGVLFEEVLAERGIALSGGNDRLGVEYIRFARERGINTFLLVKRLTGVSSASEIREAYASGGWEAAEELMAEEGLPALKKAVVCPEEGFDALLFAHARLYLGTETENDLLRYAAKIARASADPGAFTADLPTKKYTAARMRRELLFSILGRGQPERDPRFTVLLAANGRGRAVLAARRKENGIPVIVRPADTSSLDEEGKGQVSLNRSADDLYAYLTGKPAGEWMRKSAVML